MRKSSKPIVIPVHISKTVLIFSEEVRKGGGRDGTHPFRGGGAEKISPPYSSFWVIDGF
jgi:hypothetical protein